MKNILTPNNRILLLVLLLFFNLSCEDYLETDQPIGETAWENVFESESLATAAVNNLYAQLRDEVLVSGNFNGMGITMGLYADELDYYSYPGNPLESFYLHNITAGNNLVRSIWNTAYSLVYMSNSIIEGLSRSQSLDPSVRDQLTGEALFVRALCHFYLVNLYGDIPYITQTDYHNNQDVFKEDKAVVYQKLTEDLVLAKSYLTDAYPGAERIRANRLSVSAFLARVYLYNEQWEEAKAQAGEVIGYQSLYTLEQDLSEEFLKNSSSAILQLKPATEGQNTLEGAIMNFSYGPPFNVSLTSGLYNSMSDADLRKEFWITPVTDGDYTWYACSKYKETGNTGATLEYSILLRLSEQYLIRAEAHAQSGNLAAAAQDVNTIRQRAGLPEIFPATTQEMMDAILNERRWELFAEQGHRWFDLKRTGKANDVLSLIKPGWRPTDLVLPIPENEIAANPNLLPQNPGY
ncbi:MAG: RagB/SusD family nutrient uptake outer membrane protein [Moheibacter sp.]